MVRGQNVGLLYMHWLRHVSRLVAYVAHARMHACMYGSHAREQRTN
jgi:hypothetical protein